MAEHFSSFLRPNFVFVLVICLSSASAQDSAQEAPISKCEVPALGRTAQLGEFYDEVLQSFLGVLIFKEPLPPELVSTRDIQWTSSKYVMADTYQQRSQLIKLNLELVTSVCFGLVKIRGSAEYVNEQKSFTYSVTAFMDYQVRTVKESIQPIDEDIHNLIEPEFLQNVKATHIVIGIEYGGDVVVKFEDQNRGRESKHHASGSLDAVVKALLSVFSASATASTSTTSSETIAGKKPEHLSIKLFSDLSYGSNNPMNFEQLQEFIKKVPSLVHNTNNGKGKPMSYVLFPLDLLRKKLMPINHHVPTSIDIPPTLVLQLDSALLLALVQIPDQIALAHQKVHDLFAGFTENEMCLPKVHMTKLLDLQQEFESHAQKFKTQVKRMTLDVRAGQLSPEHLVNLMEKYLSSSLSPEKFMDTLDTQFNPALEKIRLCRTLTEATATSSSGPLNYFGYSASLISFHFQHTGKNVFVLYYSMDFIRQDPTSWFEQSTRFSQLAQSPANKMAIMDCEFPHADCPAQNIGKTTLALFKNGRKIESPKENEEEGEDLTASALYKFPRNAQVIEIPALGTFQKLGALFNENTRKFIGVSVLNEMETPSMASETVFAVDHTILFPRQPLLDKLRALNIPPELRISILTRAGNALPAMGSIWRYLREDHAAGLSSGLVSRIRTMKESANVSSPIFQNSLNLDRARQAGATHYIHSVFYGGTSIFEIPGPTFSSPENIQRDLQTIRTMFSNTKIISDQNKNSAGKTAKETEHIKSKTTIFFKSDLPGISDQKFGADGDLTRSVKETIHSLFQALAQSEKNGVPVAYLLHPLDSLEDQVEEVLGQTPEDPSRPGPSHDLDLDLLRYFEQLQSAEDALIEFQSALNSPQNQSCVPPSFAMEISRFIQQFSNNKSLWVERVKSALELQNPEPATFEDLSYEAREKFTASNVIQEVKRRLGLKQKGQLRKMKMCEWAKSVGVGYLGLGENPKNSLVEDFLGSERPTDVYLLFFKDEWTERPLWIKALNLFLSFLNPHDKCHNDNENDRLFLVDCDESPQLAPSCDKLTKQQPTILKYRKGALGQEISLEGDWNPATTTTTVETAEKNMTQMEASFKTMKTDILFVEKKLKEVKNWLGTEFVPTLLKTQLLAEDYCGVRSEDTSKLWNQISAEDDENVGYCTKVGSVGTSEFSPLESDMDYQNPKTPLLKEF